MKALTVRQPWASLIVYGHKWIETRTRPTKIRGEIGIIAGKHRPASFWLDDWADDGGRSKAPEPWRSSDLELDHWFDPAESIDGNGQWRYDYRWSRFPFGALIGTVELYDCVPIQTWLWDTYIGRDQRPYGDFTPGRWAWLLRNPKPLATPVPMKGAQGWQTIEEPS